MYAQIVHVYKLNRPTSVADPGGAHGAAVLPQELSGDMDPKKMQIDLPFEARIRFQLCTVDLRWISIRPK